MTMNQSFVRLTLITLSFIFIFSNHLVMAEGSFSVGAGDSNIQQTNQENGTYCSKGVDPLTLLPCTQGFDPSTITCTDSNNNGWIDQGECSWGDTSSPWFVNSAFDTQKGNGVIPGGGGSSMGQTASMAVGGPHFTMKFFNAPTAPGSTSTFGVTSTPSGNLRDQHNEFGFEVVVDKKTDPLEPYYLKFYVPYTTVESAQVSATGEMTLSPDCVGNVEACGIYSREVTEMDPNNPGVFNRYVITGTFTSNGTNYTSNPSCETGCTYYETQWP